MREREPLDSDGVVHGVGSKRDVGKCDIATKIKYTSLQTASRPVFEISAIKITHRICDRNVK